MIQKQDSFKTKKLIIITIGRGINGGTNAGTPLLMLYRIYVCI